MGKCYDNWERLVQAVIRREKNHCLCLAHSFSTSDFSYTSTSYNTSNLSVRTNPVPLHTHRNKPILAKTKTALSIFSGFSSKKNNSRKENEVKIGKGQIGYPTEISISKMKAEHKRLRELHTLKDHIESLARKRGLSLDSIYQGYTL